MYKTRTARRINRLKLRARAVVTKIQSHGLMCSICVNCFPRRWRVGEETTDIGDIRASLLHDESGNGTDSAAHIRDI